MAVSIAPYCAHRVYIYGIPVGVIDEGLKKCLLPDLKTLEDFLKNYDLTITQRADALTELMALIAELKDKYEIIYFSPSKPDLLPYEEKTFREQTKTLFSIKS